MSFDPSGAEENRICFKPHGTISSEDDFTDYALWDSLDRMIATHGCNGKYDSKYRETRQHRQEMIRKVFEARQFRVLEANGFVQKS